jgi:CubicO group peptidase (beta-lactamase class C family)
MFAAYVDGKKVVDVWKGEARPGVAWSGDTLATMWSATKGCAALCAQVLYDRGLLDVNSRVAQYWPEYGQAGKEETLVRHILNHTAGVLCFDDPGAFLDWSGKGWDDYDGIAQRLAASPPSWEPGTKIGYHAISFGWLVQELVRRVAGTTLGSFFRTEIAEPLGLSIFIGTPTAEQSRLADVMAAPPAVPAEPDPLALELLKALMDPNSLVRRAAVTMHDRAFDADFVELPKVRSLEIPAANGSGDARSLARMYAVLAQGGKLDGFRLLSRESVELFGTPTFSGPSAAFSADSFPDGVPIPENHYALGYEGDSGDTPMGRRFGPTESAFGHLGAGGQVGFADPVRGVSVGFLRNQGAEWELPSALIAALYSRL